MKKITFATLALIAAIALAGCSTRAALVIKTATSSASATEGSLPMVTQLMVGTFRLEGTEHAVTAEQAKDLLPLWKAYRSMNGSTSSSPVEVQALLKQIRGAMKEEQLKAIADMKLTPDDMMKLMQERGIDMTNNGAGGAGAASTGREAERPSLGGGGMSGPGGAPGGGNRGGGGPMPGGGMPAGGDPGMGGFPGEMPGMGTPSAQQQGKGAMAMAVPPPLYDALIDLLKSRA